jgi:hypothetical protein
MAVSVASPYRSRTFRPRNSEMDHLIDLASNLEQSAIGLSIAEGRYAFPLIEGIHLIGLSVAVGLIFLIDLRLLGVFLPAVPVRELHRQLQPYVFVGFGIIIIAGILLFLSEASAVIVSPPWPFKAFFFVLATVNALYFEFVIARRSNAFAEVGPLPGAVRRAALASLCLWGLVIVCGRLIPYIPNWT